MRAALRDTAPVDFVSGSTTGRPAGPDTPPGAPAATAEPVLEAPGLPAIGGDGTAADPAASVMRRAAPPPAVPGPQPSPAPLPGLGQLIGGVIGR